MTNATKVLYLMLICSSVFNFANTFHVPTSTDLAEENSPPQLNKLDVTSQGTVVRHAREVKDEGVSSYAQTYFDQILETLRNRLVQSGFARLSLPDLTDSFSRQILGMTFYGSASLSNGTLEGLETIHRTGPTTISAEPSGDVLVESKIGVDDATVTYDARAQFMGLGPHATVTGKLSSVEAILVVRLNPFTFTTELTKLDVLNTGDLDVQVNGLGTVLDFLGKHIGVLVGNSLKHVVLDILEDQIKTQINDIIKTLRFLPSPMQAISTAQEFLARPLQNLSSLLTGKWFRADTGDMS